MGYAPYQAYPNHPLQYPAINYISFGLYSCSPPTKLENLQPMVHMSNLIQSIQNFQLNNPSGSQERKLSPKKLRFDPIPMSYTKLLPLLIQSKLVIQTSTKPLKPHYPRWYDKNAHCEFHLGAQGY